MIADVKDDEEIGQKKQKKPISEEYFAYYMTAEAQALYPVWILPRREGETDDEFRRRSTLIWLAEEEEYALYGQFYQFKNKIQDDRPSTIVVHNA